MFNFPKMDNRIVNLVSSRNEETLWNRAMGWVSKTSVISVFVVRGPFPLTTWMLLLETLSD